MNTMGGEYSLYGRKKDTDRYVHLQDFEKEEMDLFKHNVVAYVLDKKHTDMKSLYLYRGYMRVAKALVRSQYLELTFSSSGFASAWDTSEERLDTIPWLFRTFNKKWKPVHTEYSYMRVYQKY